MSNNEKLIGIFSEQLDLNPEDVTDQLSPKNCGQWDSVKNLLLLANIETNFNISLDFQDLDKMDNFGNVKEILSSIYGISF